MKYTSQQIYTNLNPFLRNKTSLIDDWQELEGYSEMMENFPILVVGAGGLGCQMVKNLALSGFKHIHLIDMDTIDLTNLNRQFLFRQKDVGKHKALVVSQFIRKRCPGVKVYPQTCKIQEKSLEFYKQFGVIIGGLDNIEARKYLNLCVYRMNRDINETRHFYIDGATQGFQGQALLVQPYQTSCYQCTLLGGTKTKTNYCTIANTPRTPQHCIQYVNEIKWEEERKQQVKDYDNPEHLQWLYNNALARAKQYKIEGVTQMLVLGVVKNIIPAIASTNALVAAICTHEAFKIITGCNQKLNNYFFYRGAVSVGSDTFAYGKKPKCYPCQLRKTKLDDIYLTLGMKDTFKDIHTKIQKQYPSVQAIFLNYNGKILLNPGDQERFETKYNMTFETWKNNGVFTDNPIILYVTNKNLSDQLKVIVTLQGQK